MKISMGQYGNEMCDHMIDLTAHCRRCEALYRTPARRFWNRLASIVAITVAAWRTL